jgi:hypothetical protein
VTTSDGAAGLLLDAFSRVKEGVAEVLDGIDDDVLIWRPDPSANTVTWLVWHLTRIQDDHVAAAFDRPQVWIGDGWVERFGRPYPPEAHGYGMSPEEVGRLAVAGGLLEGYFEAVATRTDTLVSRLKAADLTRVVDERWDPPVTLGVRLLSVIADDLQHVGQAAYVRGLAERR